MHTLRHRTGNGKASTIRLPIIRLPLPSWLEGLLKDKGLMYPSRRDRVRLVIEMSRQNMERGTGGPFAAAIFNCRTQMLIAAGVNIVAGARCSVAHAEVMAIMAAQHIVGHYDLGLATGDREEIVSSTEPCAMCQGAIAWAGIGSLVYAARGDDARGIGFDEGPKAPDWISQFKRRGITVAGGVCRWEAVAVLRNYKKRGGLIYNGGFNCGTSSKGNGA